MVTGTPSLYGAAEQASNLPKQNCQCSASAGTCKRLGHQVSHQGRAHTKAKGGAYSLGQRIKRRGFGLPVYACGALASSHRAGALASPETRGALASPQGYARRARTEDRSPCRVEPRVKAERPPLRTSGFVTLEMFALCGERRNQGKRPGQG